MKPRLIVAALLLSLGIGAAVLARAEHRAFISASRSPIEWMLAGAPLAALGWSEAQAYAHSAWCLTARLDRGLVVLPQERIEARCRRIAARLIARTPQSGAAWAVQAAYGPDPVDALARARTFAPNEGWLARARLALALRSGDLGAGAHADAQRLAASIYETEHFRVIFQQADVTSRGWLLRAVKEGGA